MKNLIKNNSLFLAFFFPAVVDLTATLLGQDSQYWGYSRIVNEASPAYYFLVVSPWLFLFGPLMWFVLWYWLLKKLKDPLILFLMFLFISGHPWESASWIMRIFKQNAIYNLDNQPSIIFAWSLTII